MDYPVWQLGAFGGGLIIAVIATVHVLISHFAVGGGFYLVITEHYARSRGLDSVLGHVKKHARFFLLLTMVAGGLTGVGIWFAISLLSPAASSLLIRKFVFFFAAEWVAFAVEIVALLVYYYRFDQLPARSHLAVGWVYAAAGWLSLFLIGGIVSFMLTPGEWLSSGDIWDGFFNPTLWPSVMLRTAMAFTLAGVFAFLTASTVREPAERERLVRFCAMWVVAPFFVVLASGSWYLGALPEANRAMVLARNPEIAFYLDVFQKSGPVLAALAVFAAVRFPGRARVSLCVLLVVLGYALIGSFEYVREAARRPYLIAGKVYSTGLDEADADKVRQTGVLAATGWTQEKTVVPGREIEAGREVFQQACLACHSLGGPMKDIAGLTRKYPRAGAVAMLDGLGRISPYMPPFPGTRAEKEALAAYLTEGLHGKPAPEQAFKPEPLPLAVPAVQPDREYSLVAWSGQGMMFFADENAAFSLLAPQNTLKAMLIKRGDPPRIETEGVKIEYALEPDVRDPAARLTYWRYMPAPWKAPDTSGVMSRGEGGIFEARAVSVTPFPGSRGNTGIDPYPLVLLRARDAASGKVLAEARAVLPASTEMGCKNCHGGPWREQGAMGISPATATDIVSVHDRKNRTDLYARAARGTPVSCGDCHADPATNAPGDGVRLNLSSAVHGLHAAVLSGTGDAACAKCHPASPTGATRAYRGLHAQLGFGCTDCHGVIEDNALALLSAEKNAGKLEAARLIANLTAHALPKDKINPRSPWTNLPDCLTCHASFGRGGTGAASAFNVWTKDAGALFAARRDEMEAVACGACHGSPHAEYPATNVYGDARDNLVPLILQGKAAPLGYQGACAVCHAAPRDVSAHHPPPD